MTVRAIEATYQGETRSIHIAGAETVSDVIARVGASFGLVNVKLVLKGGRLHNAGSKANLEEAGLKEGIKVMVLGSKEAEVQKVLNSRDLPGMAGFDHELQNIAARRQRSNNSAIQLPAGPYTFGSYEAWSIPSLHPPPSEATKLLHKLAADPGIVDVMKHNHWRVGKLSEMPPEGKEGISPVCILGVNINAGQEISLRLRTDDLQGFRRYLSIRDTLCHELAHMVFGEHDNKFKTLNSQIRNHVERLTRSVGKRLLEAAEGWELDVPEPPQTLMGKTAVSSGKTLRQLAAESKIEIDALGHRDSETERKEKALERLSSFTSPTADPRHQPTSESNPSARQTSERTGGIGKTQQAHEESESPISETQRKAAGTDEALSHSQEQSGTIAVGKGDVALYGRGDDNLNPSQPSSPAFQPAMHETSTAKERVLEQGAVDHADSSASLGSWRGVEHPTMPQSAAEGGVIQSEAAPGAVESQSAQYWADARRAVDSLLSSASHQSRIIGLNTLLTILKNALDHPGDPRYRQIRVQNAAFQQKAGQLPGALDVLKSAGFVLKQESGEQILRLEREDPGLLWLTLSACEQALQSVA